MRKISKILVIFSIFALSLLSSTQILAAAVHKSPQDNRKFEHFTLNNGLQVVVVSDPAAEMTGVVMAVNSGSEDEPRQWQGLAHYLEHMLFLGTKKYPQVDTFMEYIQSHGGQYNAYTAYEQTVFFFDINPVVLPNVLDRFSDFFIAPLFNKDMMDREIHAVDSEFQMNANNDMWRGFEVARETANPKHPSSQFNIGNKQTLAKDKKALHEALVKFYNEHYHADNMVLAMVGPQSIQELSKLARQYFAQVPNATKTVAKKAEPLLYEPNHLGLDIIMRTDSDRRDLSISFVMANNQDPLREKAGSVLASLMNDQRSTGLLESLKQASLINEMKVSYSEFGERQDGLQFNFSLTEKGVQKIDWITEQVIAYVNLIKQQGVPQHYIDEIKQIHALNFHYTEKSSPMDLAIEIATNSKDVAPEDMLTHDLIYPKTVKLDKPIKDMLQQFDVTQIRRFIAHPDAKGQRKSQWYDAMYAVKKIPATTLTHWQSAKISKDLRLPSQNAYVPKQLKMLPIAKSDANKPTKIKMSHINLWHHQGTEFGVPRASININFMSTLPKTAKNYMLAWIYQSMVMEEMNDLLYPAALADASFEMHQHPRGLTLSMNGYSENQEVLLEQILKKISTYHANPKNFAHIKTRIEQKLASHEQAPLFTQAGNQLQTLLTTPSWSETDLLKVSKHLTIKQFNEFCQSFWQGIHADMLVNGNYTAKQAKNLGSIVEQKLNFASNRLNKTQKLKVVKLEPNQQQLHSLGERENHVAIWYLQNPNNDYESKARAMLMAKLIESPFFTQMRTEQQLGYAVMSGPFIIGKTSGMFMCIDSPSHSSDELIKRMRGFVSNFQLQMARLDDQKFNPIRDNLVHLINITPKSLDHQTNMWWGIIETGIYDFAEKQKISNAIAKITSRDMINYSNQMLGAESRAGQLIVYSEPSKVLGPQPAIESIQAFKAQSEYFNS